MSERVRHEGSDTRNHLLKAAAKEFSERGYKGASLRQICSASGVTTGALYFFFENKEDLFRNVVKPVMDPLAQTLIHSIERQLTPAAIESARRGGRVALGGVDLSDETLNFLKLCDERRDLVGIITNDRDNSVMELLINEAAAELAGRMQECFREVEMGWDPAEDEFIANWLAGTCVRSVIQVLATKGTLEDSQRRLSGIFSVISRGVSGA